MPFFSKAQERLVKGLKLRVYLQLGSRYCSALWAAFDALLRGVVFFGNPVNPEETHAQEPVIKIVGRFF